MNRCPLLKAIGPHDCGYSKTNSIVCPLCGSEYQSVGDSYTVPGNANYEAWEGRGDLLVIPFCGECGHRWELCFGSHKGNTFAYVRGIEDAGADVVRLAELGRKYRYVPQRRYENDAGKEQITEKQLAFIDRLRVSRSSDVHELEELINGYWNLSSMADWTKADGMFVIGILTKLS